MGKNDTGR
jgi:hypothetical protein